MTILSNDQFSNLHQENTFHQDKLDKWLFQEEDIAREGKQGGIGHLREKLEEQHHRHNSCQA